jgi:hypothetical protein
VLSDTAVKLSELAKSWFVNAELISTPVTTLVAEKTTRCSLFLQAPLSSAPLVDAESSTSLHKVITTQISGPERATARSVFIY